MPKIYVNVKLPEELAKEIDEILKERALGYRSRGEFVTEATRTLLLKIKTLTKEKAES
jgi:metal-responsive CopG/Arc/MetJ family transcriptional regulator